MRRRLLPILRDDCYPVPLHGCVDDRAGSSHAIQGHCHSGNEGTLQNPSRSHLPSPIDESHDVSADVDLREFVGEDFRDRVVFYNFDAHGCYSPLPHAKVREQPDTNLEPFQQIRFRKASCTKLTQSRRDQTAAVDCSSVVLRMSSRVQSSTEQSSLGLRSPTSGGAA